MRNVCRLGPCPDVGRSSTWCIGRSTECGWVDGSAEKLLRVEYFMLTDNISRQTDTRTPPGQEEDVVLFLVWSPCSFSWTTTTTATTSHGPGGELLMVRWEIHYNF